MKETSYLVWIDCEFTSLNFETNRLVEIACVITDSDLHLMGDPVHQIIHVPKVELENLLSSWTRKNFSKEFKAAIQNSSLSSRQAQENVLAENLIQSDRPIFCSLLNISLSSLN